jgi:hypothetical protein
MTVGELIEKLKEVNPELKVVFYGYNEPTDVTVTESPFYGDNSKVCYIDGDIH